MEIDPDLELSEPVTPLATEMEFDPPKGDFLFEKIDKFNFFVDKLALATPGADYEEVGHIVSALIVFSFNQGVQYQEEISRKAEG